MIKNRLGKALVAAAMLSSAAMADTVIYPDYSLIGIEGGMTSINSDVDTATMSDSVNKTVQNIGIKIGAESYNYRIFLTADYYTNPDSSYDYIGTYGGELDYLLNVSTKMNLYIGLNAGIANMKFKAPNETTKRLISNPYYGADAGLNFHASKLIDLEVGARLMMLDATNTKDNVTYTFNNFITGYASIIFKYEMH
ncbi:hypothetical protein [Sulfurimonas sp.]|uniref:hypothetical protein n=1 Tax=Sulfurimonas sp. TaxID=2022749 RepID=UPI0026130C58|nr:hypothetical protein [Sulfurimonas sp.]